MQGWNELGSGIVISDVTVNSKHFEFLRFVHAEKDVINISVS